MWATGAALHYANGSDELPIIHIISDSLGESAATMAAAAAGQFVAGHCIVERLPKAGSIDQIKAFLEAHMRSDGEDIIVFHTIADPDLRAEVIDYISDKPVKAVDLIGPAIEAISEVTGLSPSGKAGSIREIDQEYFDRIEAMEFAVNHDDGRNPEELDQADIVLIGVSRTSKTPLSIYMASRGYKVANIPLVPDIAAPAQLFRIEPWRVFGLTSQASLLSEIRYQRLGEAAAVAGAYADIGNVQQDLDDARSLMRKLGCIVVKTDNRAIEETAQEILRYYELAQGSPEGGTKI